MEEELIQSWVAMTQMIKHNANGKGSRLHKDQNGNYVAYANWSSSADWQRAKPFLPQDSETLSQQMRDSCNSIQTFFQLNEIADPIDSD